MRIASSPIKAPSTPLTLTADIVAYGPQLPPIERIRLFSDRQWEEFVLEWATSLTDYQRVDRCGGSGDMGRDVIAICSHDTNVWDNYQCKHYKDPLTPSDIWVELGKLSYYTFTGAYTYPRRYYFVAPLGAGTKLSTYFSDSSKLKSDLFNNWEKHCQHAITSTGEVPLDGPLRRHIESLNFSIFSALPPLTLIDQHSKTKWHAYRFGGGLPLRPAVTVPPVDPDAIETRYVRQLLDAYADYLGQNVSNPSDLDTEPDLLDHFRDSRREFYSAESLRVFTRDNLPSGEFEKLQSQILSGIVDAVRRKYPDAYERVLTAVSVAKSLPITDHALITRLRIEDRGGICHQLANDDKVRWKR